MGDMVLKLLWTVDVIIVGVLPHLDIGAGDDVFKKQTCLTASLG